ncbi:MAG: VanW family protein [Clostridia bacterium]|nr:VanW family protein [Clostridia bacterium]
MDMNGYTPPSPPAQRQRRSERAKYQQNTQSAAPAKPVQNAQPVQQSVAQPPRKQPSSSRQSRPQDDWQQGAHPGRQGYQPAKPVRQAAPYQSGWGQQPYQPTYQQSYGAPNQPAAQQPYGYQEQPRQQGNPYGGSYFAPQGRGMQGYPQEQPRQGGRPPRKTPVLRNILLIILCVGIIAGAVVGGRYMLQQKELTDYVASYDNVFCNGVYVDGIHLGGMTADQGIAAVQMQAQQRSDAWSVRLTYQGQLVTEIKASQLNMSVDVMAVLNEAWQQGRTGDTKTRKAAMDALLVTPYQGYTAMPSGDTSVIDTILDGIRNQVYRAPQNAAIISFNPEKTVDLFTFQEEVPGRYLDTAPLKEQIYQMVSTMTSGSIEVNPVEIQPDITVAMLKETVALRGSAYTKISTTSTEDRNKNIIRSCNLISGTIIQPGQTFSFNEVVGKRTVENGFYKAIEYANGEHVEGIGGGVCQTSSTVYLASVAAGMEIVKREPHSDEVNYTAYGMDATVYWEYGRKIDYVFRNNTDKPIYMVARVQSDPDSKRRLICKVEIYGASMGDVTYSLETQTVEILQPGADVIVKDKKAEYVTYTDEQYVQRKAAEGCVVDSFRVKYVNGVEVERVKLYTDRYEAKAKRIYVGVTERTAW